MIKLVPVFGEPLVLLEHAMGLLKILVVKDLTVFGIPIKRQLNVLPLLLAHLSQEIATLNVKFIETLSTRHALGQQELLALSQPPQQ